MIKISIVYLFLLSIIIQVFSIVIVFVSFKYNEKYIQENICVNSHKVSLSCKGQCFLLKNIAPQNSGCPKQQHNSKVLQFLLEHNSDFLSLRPNIVSFDLSAIRLYLLKKDNFSLFKFISQNYLKKPFKPPILDNIQFFIK